jgi:hypothetical protein
MSSPRGEKAHPLFFVPEPRANLSFSSRHSLGEPSSMFLPVVPAGSVARPAPGSPLTIADGRRHLARGLFLIGGTVMCSQALYSCS